MPPAPSGARITYGPICALAANRIKDPKLSSAVATRSNGVVVALQVRDDKRLKGTLRTGTGSRPAPNGGAQYGSRNER